MTPTIYIIPIAIMAVIAIITINRWQRGDSHWMFVASVSSLISMLGFTYEMVKGIYL